MIFEEEDHEFLNQDLRDMENLRRNARFFSILGMFFGGLSIFFSVISLFI